MNYEEFTLPDFLNDDLFIAWVKDEDADATSFWQRWEASSPINLSVMKQAERVLCNICSVEPINIPPGTSAAIFSRIDETINNQKVYHISFTARKRRLLVAISAAAVLFISILTVWFGKDPDRQTKIITAFGELKYITLSDSSLVTLNANSSLRFYKKPGVAGPRELWLDGNGEAMFNIQHLNKNPGDIKKGDLFNVHTQHLEVVVLGTVFNIKERRGIATVSLEKGSVKVIARDDTLKQVILSPGESVSYNAALGTFTVVNQLLGTASAWTEKKLLLDNTAVGDILQQIEDTYGYRILLQDQELATRRIDGYNPIKNIENMLFILCNTLNATAEKQGDSTYILKPKPKKYIPNTFSLTTKRS